MQSLANVKQYSRRRGWLFPKIFKQNPTGILLEMMPFDKYFLNELKPPTSNQYVLCIVFAVLQLKVFDLMPKPQATRMALRMKLFRGGPHFGVASLTVNISITFQNLNLDVM